MHIGCYIFRYGRITVSTLESKLASAEKDVTRLTKALERSDKYIEELESELDGYRGGKTGDARRQKSAAEKDERERYLHNGDGLDRKYSSDSKVPQSKDYGIGLDNPSRRQLFTDDKGQKSTSSSSGERSRYSYERNGDINDDLHAGKSHSSKSNNTNGGKKRVTFDLEKNTNSAMSFDLELPSPLKNSVNASSLNGRASPVKSVLKKANGSGKTESNDRSNEGYSTDLSKTLEDSLSDSYNAKYSGSKDDDLLYVRSRSKDGDYESSSRSRRKYSADDSMLSEPSDLEIRRAREKDYSARKPDSDYLSRRPADNLDELDRHELDDTQYIESELDELNISLTPEFTDCMKILNRAEKNVHTRDTDSEDFTPKYKSSTVDPMLDAGFRASTGSIGYRTTTSSSGDDFLLKPDSGTDRLASSVDSYSRGRHMRTGSLDNLHLLTDPGSSKDSYRPGSGLGSLGASSGGAYPPSSQSKYSTGLTTGRTTLTRTPSLDNLLLGRQATGHGNKYSSVEDHYGLASRQGYLGQRLYRGETDTAGDGTTSTGGASTLQPLAAKHDLLGTQSSATGMGEKFDYMDSRTRSYSGGGGGGGDIGSSSSVMGVGSRLPPSGRQTPTLSGTEYDKITSASTARVAPTIPTHSEYMGYTRAGTDKYSSSGRSTPTLTSHTDYTAPSGTASTGISTTQYSGYRSSGPSSLPTDLGQKSGSVNGRSGYSSYSTNTAPSYANTSLASNIGGGYSSLPSYSGSDTGSNNYTSGRSNMGDQTDVNYKSDGKFSSLTNTHAYNDINYKDGTDFSKFSTKIAGSSSTAGYSMPPPSTMPSNPMSVSVSAGLASSYAPYVPGSSLASSASSYSTSHSVPVTHTTSSYSSSVPASNTYSHKPLDPIAESAHYSYVSNVSGDFSSKNDTFGLPEPKKRLFDNSDDLEMSMSPIKSNRKY